MKLNLEAEKSQVGKYGQCILHGDYHKLESQCWESMLRFYFDFSSRVSSEKVFSEASRRVMYHKYSEIVERQMLDKLLATT